MRGMAKAMAAGVVVVATVAVAGCSSLVVAPDAREARAVVVPLADDEYVGYFDAVAEPVSDGDAVGVMRGSFGAGREVSPVGWSDGSAAPGAYAVTVECAGNADLDIRFDQEDRRKDPTARLACPGRVAFDATTTAPGYLIELDSAGEPGAYRISVARRSAS